MALQLISSIATFLYGGTITALYYGLLKLKTNSIQQKPLTTFSIIIPFRDEEDSLQKLFNSLLAIDYPVSLFEVIAVNDHSSDASVSLLEELQAENPELKLRILHSPEPSKKAALTFGISQAEYPWIVTTDADCCVPKYWLQQFNSIISYNKVTLIAGPVSCNSNKSFLEEFQRLDFLSLQGTTMGIFGLNVPFMCNGANLCYSKAAFNTVGGFEGNEHIASGDDVFLLEKIVRKYPKQIHYSKTIENSVISEPQKSWKKLISQRMRWAGKASAYSNPFGIIIGCIVLVCNVLLLVLLITDPLVSAILFFTKGVLDYIFLQKTGKIFQQSIGMQSFVLSALLYPFFSSIIFIASQLGTFRWKGRVLKR
ncbi:MAG: glycosyltransferase family 2 protein [Flavicella sp.]